MTTALSEREPWHREVKSRVTPDELDLVRKTVANGATPDELKLYLYDCQRQGVHPLDKLIHFTVHKDKSGGRKYTPITSIDFMRIRAADTGEYAGSDDAAFVDAAGSPEFAACVTIWRLVQGQRCSFTATARWAEYKPSEDFMWRKMPHTMLAKCAEALALRKGFPRQLAGLYAKEELDQADSPRNVIVEAAATPASSTATSPAPPLAATATDAELGTSAPNVPDSGQLPTGAVLITKVEEGSGKAKAFIHHSGQTVSLHGNDGIAIYDDALVSIAAEVCQSREPVLLELKTPASGKSYVKAIRRIASDDARDHDDVIDVDRASF